jgi:PAS domain-containing protein
VARLNAFRPDDETPIYEERYFQITRSGNVETPELPKEFEWFSNRLKAQTKPASLLGKIAYEHDFDSQTDNVLRYTIPLRTKLNDDGSRIVNLMLVTINLDGFWSKQFWRFVYMCIGVGLFLVFTFNIFQDYFLLKKEFSALAEKVDKVMTDAKTPYVRLNSENEFVSVNDSFLRLLDYNRKEELEKEGGRTFKSILTPESQREYERILRTSVSGLDTDQYSITLIRRDRSKIRARVHGERIVFPAFRRKKYPHRFGIIISWKKVNDDNKEGLDEGVREGNKSSKSQARKAPESN